MKTFIVDSFTDTPFKGNPAGVCFPAEPLSAEAMLLVARELNLSETAFIGTDDAEGRVGIRYFSPKMEIPLCGHATLASAKVLFETRSLHEVRFVTGQDLELTVREKEGRVEMDFPAYQTHPAMAPPGLLRALGLDEVANVGYNAETDILLLEIRDADVLARLDPDFAALATSHDSISGVLVTAPAGDDGYDFHSRYFWPWSGTNEDPVTGATHTFLTPYWSARLNKRKLRSFQSSERTGSMEVELMEGDKVMIRGQAVIVLEGEMAPPAL